MHRVIITLLTAAALLSSCASAENAAPGGGQAAAVQPPANPTTVITLESKDAKLVTQSRLVYNANANCVAWWEKKTDEISWTLEIKEAGEYYVIAAVACDPQFPGSTVGVTVNNQTLTFEVPDTGSWSNYKDIAAGKIALQPGTYPVVVKAIKIPSSFVANLRTLSFMK
jgi:hypothetical protein